MQQITVPFRPNLQGIFRERFYEKIQIFDNESLTTLDIAEIVKIEVEWVSNDCNINIEQREIYRAAWLLLRDLIRTGWIYELREGVLELTLPSAENTSVTQEQMKKIKDQLRDCMEMSRLERLEESKEFISRMESGFGAKGKIQDLIADKMELYELLNSISKMNSENDKLNALRTGIIPYLDYVDNSVDEITGLKKSDIWRYFRYSWSNTSESTPGRTMLYLIRDAGQKNHPIMGIASLENTALQLTKRDDYLGWTPDAFIDSIQNSKDSYENKISELITYIDMGIKEIKIEGLCSVNDIENPSETIINKLKDIMAKENKKRAKALKEDFNDEEKSDLGGISKKAENALYLRKRADQLAQLLNSKLQMKNLIQKDNLIDYKNFVNSEDGKSIIRIALLTVKKIHIGSSMMELNVCGAIPPYNSILGGKLVALLMLSKEVLDKYKEKYGDTPSEIASRMKGEPVIKPADVVFIGTTSLYFIGSSQYNRLKLPRSLFGGTKDVYWRQLGTTAGYGTMHISDVTTKSLCEVAERNIGYNQINHVFGEGTSPKLRLINTGVRCIMEDNVANLAANQFPKHSMPRIIYGASLVSNLHDYLFGKADAPEYYYGENTGTEVSDKIIDYWKTRWLKMRLNHREALEEIKAFDKEEFLISNILRKKHDLVEFKSFQEANDVQGDGVNKLDYVRNLYRGSSAIADKSTMEELDFIHIETDLDKAIIDAVKKRKSVVLTGNAGDGKTHLIRELESTIREVCPNIVIEYDASQKRDIEVYETWKNAVNEGKVFLVAINEAVICELYGIESSRNELPQVKSAYEQIINAVYYDEEYHISTEKVVVFDLSLRNNLDKKIISQVLSKLTGEDVREKCKSCSAYEYCDFVRNCNIFRDNNQVIDRLQFVFDKMIRRGFHFTLREVMAYFSFLLFGGRNCKELPRTSSDLKYSLQNLIFGSDFGEGKMFDIVKSTFDPANISVPIIDEQLINGNYGDGEWIDEFNSERAKLEFKDYNGFCSRKRAFYFFNSKGKCIQEIFENDEDEFDILFDEKKQRDALNLMISRINCFFGLYEKRDKLYAWQSHRFGYNSQSILCAKCGYTRKNFEVILPKLCNTMRQGFDLCVNYVLLRFKEDTNVTLKVDYKMFELLAKAQRGIPVIYIDDDNARRIWKFIEQLDMPLEDGEDEVEITIYDTQTGQIFKTEIDLLDRKYLSIREESRI